MAEFFSARWKIDAEDFQRQLAESSDLAVTTELREFITDSRQAADAMRAARRNALMKAHKALLQRIAAEHQKIYDRHLFPVAASEDVRAWLDQELIKVEA